MGRLESLSSELASASGRVIPVAADVTKHEDITGAIAAASDGFGKLDALVNNAGMEIQGSIRVLELESFETMLRTNVLGPYLCMKAALPHLEETRGCIVNIGSTVVVRAPRDRFGYVATKGALEAMSLALAGDLGSKGVRVNVIRPGIVPSELRGLSEEEESRSIGDRSLKVQALGDVGRGEDVAGAVSYLISDDASWVTGAVLDVDGGFRLGVTR